MSEASQLHTAAERIGDTATSVIGNMAGTVVQPGQGAKQLVAALKEPWLLLVLAAVVSAYVVGRRRRG